MMHEEIRRCIAYAIACKGSELSLTTVYSYTDASYTQISAVKGGFFDHALQAHVGFTETGLFHHGTGHHISLSSDENGFYGFDHDMQQHFRARIAEHCIQVYDYSMGEWYNYTCSSQAFSQTSVNG